MRPAFDRENARTSRDHRPQRSHADGRHVESHVLLRLGDLHDREAALVTKLTRAMDAGVGAFDRFDGQHGAVLDADALADVETAHLLGDVPTEFECRFAWLPDGGRPAICPGFTSSSGAKSVAG